MLDLYKISGIVGSAVKAVEEKYGSDLDGIESATIPELLKLKGVGNLSAAAIFRFYHTSAFDYAMWWHSEHKPARWKKSKDDIFQSYLGDRITTILHRNRLISSFREILHKTRKELVGLSADGYRGRARHRPVTIKLSEREAAKIYSFFHDTAAEFYSESWKGKPRQKESAEYIPHHSDEELNRTLELLLGGEVADWKEKVTEEKVFREITHFYRYILGQENQHKRVPINTQIIFEHFIDFRNIFDSVELENKFYRDRNIGDILRDKKYEEIINRFRES